MSEDTKEEKVERRVTADVAPKKPVTVGEFKAMIAGIDIMGGQDFTPNREQWKRIRSMIDRLEESPPAGPGPAIVTSAPPASTYAPNATPLPTPRTEEVRPVVAGPNPWETGQGIPMPKPEGVPQGPYTRGPSTAGGGASALAPPAATPTVPEGPAEKTPDIDSSGGYNSGFE